MRFDRRRLGPQGLSNEDLRYDGSRYSKVREALFLNRYYLTWGGGEERPLPIYAVRLRYALAGLWRRWRFQQASDRSIDSRADLRWGDDRLGFRRILHPNGVCLFGTWEIDPDAGGDYTGHFAPGSRALLIARYSVCCTETRSGEYRSLSLVGKVYPTLDAAHANKLRPASFITQEDLGGSKSYAIGDVELRNAPDITPWARGWGLPVFLLTGFVLGRTDQQNAVRQLYEVAELGKPSGQPTRAPEFIRLLAPRSPDDARAAGVDFRDEILGHIYDPGDPVPRRTLTFDIEVSDTGQRRGLLVRRWQITGWRRIGRLVFSEAVASYNGDFVLHYPHPAWRRDRNDPKTVVRQPVMAAP
ncbi:MAG TPA: hypothetical protein VM819_09530 [Vicinamibacterales bacterium]|nr:hypothetical protein [Vicinamibacterales bacterium]